MAGRIDRGDIRFCRFEAPDKTRPVLILTRQLSIPLLSRVTVAPITSTIRDAPSEVLLGPDDGMKQPCVINLHNLITVPHQDLGRRLAQLGEERMGEVCRALGFALGCGD